MAWWSTPHPQEDEQPPAPLPLLPVDPDSTPSTEEDEPFLRFPQWERDEDGWPIIPGPGTMPPIWRDE